MLRRDRADPRQGLQRSVELLLPQEPTRLGQRFPRRLLVVLLDPFPMLRDPVAERVQLGVLRRQVDEPREGGPDGLQICRSLRRRIGSNAFAMLRL